MVRAGVMNTPREGQGQASRSDYNKIYNDTLGFIESTLHTTRGGFAQESTSQAKWRMPTERAGPERHCEV